MTEQPLAPRQIAEHMVQVHRSITAARDWAEAHAASHIGRNPAAVAHWDRVSKELTAMVAEQKSSNTRA